MNKRMAVAALLGAGAVLVWVVDGMHPEALAMALGMLFGVLAGVPMALIVLTSERRNPPAPPPEIGAWRQWQEPQGAENPQRVHPPARVWVIDGEWHHEN